MIDVLKSLKSAAEERIKSPVIGVVVFLYLIMQWKVCALLLLCYKYDNAANFLTAVEETIIAIDWVTFSLTTLFILFLVPSINLIVDLGRSVLDVLYSYGNGRIRNLERMTLDDSRKFREEIILEKKRSLDLVEREVSERKNIETKNIQLQESLNVTALQIQSTESILEDLKSTSSLEMTEARKTIEATNKRLDSVTEEVSNLKKKLRYSVDAVKDIRELVANEIRGKSLNEEASRNLATKLLVFFFESEKFDSSFHQSNDELLISKKLSDHFDAPNFTQDAENNLYSKDELSKYMKELNESPEIKSDIGDALKKARFGIVEDNSFQKRGSIHFCIKHGLISIINSTNTTTPKKLYKISKLGFTISNKIPSLTNLFPEYAPTTIDNDDNLPF